MCPKSFTSGNEEMTREEGCFLVQLAADTINLHLFLQKSFSISIDISMQIHLRKSVGILMK